MIPDERIRARVTAVYRDRCLLQFPDAERTAEVTGRFRYETDDLADFPSVGDWVLASVAGPDLALIHSLLPRRSVVSRKAAGRSTEEQVLAANVDYVFVVTSFNEDFNLRRIERYLALARKAPAEPVILVNKSDLAEAGDERLERASGVAGGAPVYGVSATTGDGCERITTLLSNGTTAIFLGSSGVGKSSLLNRLLEKDVQATQDIRLSDAHGRHTTTSRQMFALPTGGFVIDTPGLREIGLWGTESVLSDVYPDIAALAGRCRFRDCLHHGEAGCAVAQAIDSGELDPGRWQGFSKLQKEFAYLKRKQDPKMQANSKRRWKKIHKSMRDYLKRKRG